MTEAAKAVIEREVLCRCGRCEEAIADILRMERMLCHGGRNVLARKRNELRRIAKRSRDRIAQRKHRELRSDEPCRAG